MLVGCPLNGGAAASTSEKDCRKAGVNTTNICYNLEPLSCQAKWGLGPLFFGTKTSTISKIKDSDSCS